jgi:hypothetical protein
MKKIHLIFIAIGLIAVTSYSSALYARGSTVTLCANKKSGALRYIKSGNCKSSENKIELDQNGEVGQTGPQGPAGPAGPAGSDGSNGANGSNASSVMLQDATGAKFVWVPNYILWNGMMWSFSQSVETSVSYISALPYYYLDSACRVPIYPANSWAKTDGLQKAFVTTSDHTVNGQILSGWRRTGSLLSIQRTSTYYSGISCVSESGNILIDGDGITSYYAAEAIAWPVVVSPTTFVLGS